MIGHSAVRNKLTEPESATARVLRLRLPAFADLIGEPVCHVGNPFGLPAHALAHADLAVGEAPGSDILDVVTYV